MPIRRPNNNDPDWMARVQDEELKSLEKRISALYDAANNELTAEYARFYANFQREYESRRQMVESGDMSEIEFENWCRNRIFRSNRYQAMIRMLTDVLVNADVAAMATVNEQLPYTLAQSYDFISSLGFEAADQAGISMGTFQIYNSSSVQAIIRDNPDLLPVVDLPEDQLWNRNHINNEITQAIIQGDSMQQVARRLQNVAQMDNNAAIRNARTSMTAAENLGRSESARRLRQRGLPVKEVWSATHDSRTRDTHLLLDGTEKNEDGYYGVGILGLPLRFPADPRGEGKEIYNCRCRENVVIAGIDHSRDDELYEQFMRENYPEDWNELERRRADIHTGEGRREVERLDALDRQARLREERQANQPAPQPTYRTATNRAEAMELLHDIGFAEISNRAGKMDEDLLVSTANRLSELSSRYVGIPEGMEFTMEAKTRSANAYVAYQYNGTMKALNLNGKRYTGITEAEYVESQRGRFQPSIDWLHGGQERKPFSMPCAEDNIAVYTVTHEYGHILQGTYFFTDEYREEFNTLIANGARIGDNRIRRLYNSRLEEVSRNQRLEILEIAVERNPNFDLQANISRYGMTDNEEFFAECFANAHCGEPNELGLAMQEWLRRQGYEG